MLDVSPPDRRWIRLVTLIDESGLPAVLACLGNPASPAELAIAEAAELKRAGAEVTQDLTGYRMVRLGDPAVHTWQVALDARVTELASQVEAATEASRSGT